MTNQTDKVKQSPAPSAIHCLEIWLDTPQVLGAMTVMFIIIGASTKEPAIWVFDVFLAMAFAYRLIGTLLNEIQKR